MAKVMISMPADLLERLDAQAQATGESRSGFLQRLVERDLDAEADLRHEEFERLFDSIEIDLGGKTAAEVIREDRESH